MPRFLLFKNWHSAQGFRRKVGGEAFDFGYKKRQMRRKNIVC
jgi:hypothetical protein